MRLVSGFGGRLSIWDQIAELIPLLAVNALIFTVLILVAIGFVVYRLVGRPLVQAVTKTCDQIDLEKEAIAKQEQLNKEEEARLRVLAEQELEAQFPHLHSGSE